MARKYSHKELLRTVVRSTGGRLLYGDDNDGLDISADEVLIRQMGYKPDRKAWEILAPTAMPDSSGHRILNLCGNTLAVTGEYKNKIMNTGVTGSRYVGFKDVDGDFRYYSINMDGTALIQLDMTQLRNMVSRAVAYSNFKQTGQLDLTADEYKLAQEALSEYKKIVEVSFKQIDELVGKMEDLINDSNALQMSPALLFELYDCFESIVLNCSRLTSTCSVMAYYDAAMFTQIQAYAIEILKFVREKRIQYEPLAIAYYESYVLFSTRNYKANIIAAQKQNDTPRPKKKGFLSSMFDANPVTDAVGRTMTAIGGIVAAVPVPAVAQVVGGAIAVAGMTVTAVNGYTNGGAANVLNAINTSLGNSGLFSASGSFVGGDAGSLADLFASRYQQIQGISADEIYKKIRG